MKCQHLETRNVYEQRPRSEGRVMKAAGRICKKCGQVFPRDKGAKE